MNKFDALRASHVNQRFGSLVVTAYISRAEGYLCVCDCGHLSVTLAIKRWRRTAVSWNRGIVEIKETNDQEVNRP